MLSTKWGHISHDNIDWSMQCSDVLESHRAFVALSNFNDADSDVLAVPIPYP